MGAVLFFYSLRVSLFNKQAVHRYAVFTLFTQGNTNSLCNNINNSLYSCFVLPFTCSSLFLIPNSQTGYSHWRWTERWTEIWRKRYSGVGMRSIFFCVEGSKLSFLRLPQPRAWNMGRKEEKNSHGLGKSEVSVNYGVIYYLVPSHFTLSTEVVYLFLLRSIAPYNLNCFCLFHN